jgi:glycosyltransferase involved in cell wall biosynthesis
MAKLEPGGAQLAALRLVAPMRKLGIETRLLAGFATEDGIALCESHGVSVESFGSAHDLQYTCCKRFARWLAPRLADADVVHAHMLGAWMAAARACRAEVPLVASEHNACRWPRAPQTKKMREALSAVDLFFAHGPAARHLVLELGFPVERLRAGISPLAGLDSQALAGLPSPRIVYAGRLHHEKGPDLLLEAVAQLSRPPATLILGAGPLEADLKNLALALGVDDVTRFLGWQEEPGSFIAGASALVVPSRYEAWSQTAVMGMGLRVPVIGTAVEGLPLTLGADRGLLVPPEGRRKTDLDGACEYAFRFSPERVAEVYASAYLSLVPSTRANSLIVSRA